MTAKKKNKAGLELGCCRLGSLGRSLEVTFEQRPRQKLHRNTQGYRVGGRGSNSKWSQRKSTQGHKSLQKDSGGRGRKERMFQGLRNNMKARRHDCPQCNTEILDKTLLSRCYNQPGHACTPAITQALANVASPENTLWSIDRTQPLSSVWEPAAGSGVTVR